MACPARRAKPDRLAASFTFDDGGIDADTVTGSGRVEWSALTQMKRDERVLVIKRDRIPVVWIPARAFASTADRDELEEFVLALSRALVLRTD